MSRIGMTSLENKIKNEYIFIFFHLFRYSDDGQVKVELKIHFVFLSQFY